MPTPAQPAATDAELAERRRRQELAHELAELSVDLARTAHAEAKQSPTPAALHAFERVARGARRALLLAQKLGEAPRPATRAEARREVARQVEARIAAVCEAEGAETLHAELAERLDRLDADDDLLRHPVREVVERICADLGLEAGDPPRRTAAERSASGGADIARVPDAALLRACRPAERNWLRTLMTAEPGDPPPHPQLE